MVQSPKERDLYGLVADVTGLLLHSRDKRRTGYAFEAQQPLQRGFNFHLTHGDLSNVAGESHFRVYRTPMCIHIDTPSGQRLLDCPRKERSMKVYGSRGADPRHQFSWKGRDYMLSGHLRFGGKHRVCRDIATGQKVASFKHSLLNWKEEGTITMASEIPGEDADVIMAAFLGFYMFDERRDSKIAYCV